jgi:hypothetical protein
MKVFTLELRVEGEAVGRWRTAGRAFPEEERRKREGARGNPRGVINRRGEDAEQHGMENLNERNRKLSG